MNVVRRNLDMMRERIALAWFNVHRQTALAELAPNDEQEQMRIVMLASANDPETVERIIAARDAWYARVGHPEYHVAAVRGMLHK